MDEATSELKKLEAQMNALDDLSITITDANVLAAIQSKKDEFATEVKTAQVAIDQARDAFNTIAEENIVVQAKRKAELAEIEKQKTFNDAKTYKDGLEYKLSDYRKRLEYFDEDQTAADEGEKVRPCEP